MKKDLAIIFLYGILVGMGIFISFRLPLNIIPTALWLVNGVLRIRTINKKVTNK